MMTSAATTISASTEGGARRDRHGWLARLALDTLGYTGCRLGVAWVAVLVVLGVFAPLIANSRPWLIHMDGKWSSPLLAGLTRSDVILLAAAVTAIVLALGRGWSARRRVAIFAGVMVITTAAAFTLMHPLQLTVYEQYREAQAQGRVTFVLNAPLPFSPTDRLRDQFDMQHPHPWPPSWRHPMGTERNGADVLARMIHACRIALSIGLISTGIATIIGVIVGGLMGYFSGWVDLVGMRVVEVFSAIPTLYLLLTFVAFFGRDLYMMMVIIGLTSWVGDARFVRAEFLKLRQQEFVQAARAQALPLWSILFRHMLPNGMAPLLVSASFGVASAILAETTLSFLGLGLVDDPSWGELLNQALGAGGRFNWWLAAFPGLAIFLTVFAYNLIGESLRDVIDPHTQRTSQL